MLRLFLDTEFNSFHGSLISIAVVADDGREFYAVVDVPAQPHPWVAEHVLPILNAPPVGYQVAQERLHRFLATISGPIQVIADWPEDHAHFLTMLCFEGGRALAKSVFAILAPPPREPKPVQPHNALSDARALRNAWLTA